MPEHAAIAEVDQRLQALGTLLIAGRTEISDIEREQAKADADVEQVRSRAARDQQRLDSGSVSSAKDLQALQHELQTLARRQNDLEDIELEVMERLEQAQRRQSEAETQKAELDERRATLIAARDQALADLKAEAAGVSAERAALAPTIDDELLALYTKLRGTHDGVGAARLHQRRCEGCRMELTATDISRIRAAADDEVLRCEQCRRILVRTPESGL